MAAKFTAPLLSLMSSGQSYNGSDSRISLALGIVCYPHTCIPQPPFWFPSETVPMLPGDAHPHVSATALPQPCSQAWHPPALHTHLSMRRRHTIPRISTSPLSCSCWHPILVAMKEPVRPMPALQDRQTQLCEL